jgi:general stress protein 26
VQKLDALVDGMKVALMTTRRRDGHLVSRPMAVQKKEPGADFWFVTERGSDKVAELRRDPHVNLGFYKDRTREWVSVAGTAILTDDRRIIGRLWAPDWKAWFEDKGGAEDGSASDPRLLLIGVSAKSAHFLSIDKPQPVVLFELLKGTVTGKKPDIGRVRKLSSASLHRKRAARKGTAPKGKRPPARTKK